jgi:hypothetical protein
MRKGKTGNYFYEDAPGLTHIVGRAIRDEPRRREGAKETRRKLNYFSSSRFLCAFAPSRFIFRASKNIDAARRIAKPQAAVFLEALSLSQE